MEILIPHIVPDETVRRIFLSNLESLYAQLNQAHGSCLNDEPTQLFDSNPEREKEIIENLLESIDILHGFYLNETIANMRS